MADKVSGITRRDFLKLAGLTGVLTALGLSKDASTLPKSDEIKAETTRTLPESIDNFSRLPTKDNLSIQERKGDMVADIAVFLEPLIQTGRLDDLFISSKTGDTSSNRTIGIFKRPQDIQQQDFTPFGPGLIKRRSDNVEQDYFIRFAGIDRKNALGDAMGDELPSEVRNESGYAEYNIPISTSRLIGILHKLKENGQLVKSLTDPLSGGMEEPEGSIDFSCLGEGILVQKELASIYDETIKDIVGADVRNKNFLVDIIFAVELRNGLWTLDTSLTFRERPESDLQYTLNLRLNEDKSFTLDVYEPQRGNMPDKDEMVKRQAGSDLSLAVIVPPILEFALHSLCNGETKQYI